MFRIILGLLIAVAAIHVYQPREIVEKPAIVEVDPEPEIMRAGETEIMAWFRGNLREPGSLEIIDWSGDYTLEDGGKVVAVKYRAANGFGGFTVETRGFVFAPDGAIIGTRKQ